ncbi:MAG: A/G-specific adenine glycosylase [Treponema sp.]|nr:A/G-specific adenine glycosylase [Treponema sp.]
MEINEFRDIVYSYYEKAGRKLPWRENINPWGVMVSEFMLQQTRVERVIPFWQRWMEKWPDIKDFAAASMEDALREWSGLGYNRRGYFLKKSADMIVRHYDGRIPGIPQNLAPLPGIGPYIAGAIACFAYNYPSVFIETNIRSAVIFSFFPERSDVRDTEIMPLLDALLDRKKPRLWYYALMDYGAYLKKTTENPGKQSAHYSKQSPFAGSLRQARGKVLRTLISVGPSSPEEIGFLTKINEDELYRVLLVLKKEAMVSEAQGIYRIAY